MIRCTYLKMACNQKTASLRVKRIDFWDVLVTCICGPLGDTFDGPG